MHRGRALGIGLIGCGTIAYWQHLPTLARLRGVRIAGLADPDPAALERAQKKVNAPGFASAEELLALDSVEAVVIASPTSLHAAHARAACLAGRHVYVEKPLAHDAASLSVIHRATQPDSGIFAVGYNLRFHPACREVRRRLASGSIGGVRAIVSEFAEPARPSGMPEWKRGRASGGGVLLDLASHHLDLYRWLLQDDLAGVTADTRSLHSEQDSAFVRARSGHGVELQGYFSFTSSRAHSLTIHATGAVLRLDLHSGRISEEQARTRYGVRRRPVAGGFAWQARKWVQPSWDPSHSLAMRAFVAAIRESGCWPGDLATATDGVAALQGILDAEAGIAGRTGSGPGAGSGAGRAGVAT